MGCSKLDGILTNVQPSSGGEGIFLPREERKVRTNLKKGEGILTQEKKWYQPLMCWDGTVCVGGEGLGRGRKQTCEVGDAYLYSPKTAGVRIRDRAFVVLFNTSQIYKVNWLGEREFTPKWSMFTLQPPIYRLLHWIERYITIWIRGD